jgi:hypothetical protein
MAGEVDPSFVVSDEAFAYLRLQKGRLEPLADDRKRWHIAYEHALLSDYMEMRAHLPAQCWGLLDIGSGLGGIDVLLSRHYGTQPYLYLLDGVNDPPEMKLHRETFSNERVARGFLRSNGVRSDRIGYYGPDATSVRAPYDLVLSLGSWCFHYEPNVYLPRLMAGGGLHVDSRLIVDLRRDKPEWEAQLFGVGLRALAIVRESAKFRRIVFVRE